MHYMWLNLEENLINFSAYLDKTTIILNIPAVKFRSILGDINAYKYQIDQFNKKVDLIMGRN